MPAGGARVNRNPIQANTMNYAGGRYSQQQNMIMEAFRAEEYIKDQMDVQAEPVYDTITLATGDIIAQGSTTSQFFKNIQNKTLNLTNMTESGQLMNPEALAIFAYRFYLDPRNSVLDCEQVLAGFAFVFTMGRKPYQTIPLWMIPQGGGLDLQGCCSDCIVHNGRPTKEAIRLDRHHAGSRAGRQLCCRSDRTQLHHRRRARLHHAGEPRWIARQRYPVIS